MPLLRAGSGRHVLEDGGQVLGYRPDGVYGQHITGPRREPGEPTLHVVPVPAFVPAGDPARPAFQPRLVDALVRTRADEDPEPRAGRVR
jgi:hypothetical protein